MSVRFASSDGRLLARVIHLAHRFGCTYAHLSTLRHDGVYVSVVEFEGHSAAVMRLEKHIAKLIAIEGETFQ